jgi:hypothetical protein
MGRIHQVFRMSGSRAACVTVEIETRSEVLERFGVVAALRDHAAEQRRERLVGTPIQSAHAPNSGLPDR